MTPAEREALLLLAGYISRLEGGLASDQSTTSPLAERLKQLISTIKAEHQL